MLRNHLDMIGRNEPIQRKAKFWQSYVRALKGTDDMRAPDRISSRPRGIFRPLLPLSSEFPELSSSWPYNKSIYDDPSSAGDRITVPGYRYLPVHREIYGYSPRNLYPRPVLAPYDHDKAWLDHLRRLADIDRFYPSKYPLSYRYGLGSPSPRRSTTPAPSKALSPAPSEKSVGFNYAGQPIYTRGGLTRRPLSELLEPLTSLPMSRITRDPWWWEYPELRPYQSPYVWPYTPYTPFYLRDSYLSPVKRTYLWDKHPIRPFAHIF